MIAAESYLYFVRLVGILKATFGFIVKIKKNCSWDKLNHKSIGLNAIYTCEIEKKSNVDMDLIKC